MTPGEQLGLFSSHDLNSARQLSELRGGGKKEIEILLNEQESENVTGVSEGPKLGCDVD